MRLVFMGSGAFATPTLQALIESGHEVALVFTQPDRGAGRGRHRHATPIKQAAMDAGITLYQPLSLKSAGSLARMQEAACEMVVVVAYGHLLPPAMLQIPARGCINAHASLLPKYRGAAPVPHAILNGEAETGVTVFRLNERFDQGDVLARRAVPILPDDTSGSLLARLAPVAAGLVLEVVGETVAGWLRPVPQVETEATRAPKLAKQMGEIDWCSGCREIEHRVRAFQPWPTAYTFMPARGARLRASLLRVSAREAGAGEAPEPGTVVAADAHAGLLVACGDGILRLERIKPAGKRQMRDIDFLCGHQLQPGVRLG